MNIRNIAIMGAAALAVGAGAVAVNGGSGGSETVSATFADASPLEVGNEVRVDGVRVGQVRSIRLQGRQALVKLSVDKSSLPWHQDARLSIRPINVLGENYVAIDPGTDSKPFFQGTSIPLARTSSSVQLQDLLDTFDDPTSAALAAMVTTLGEGTRDGGQNMADAIKALAPTMDDLSGLGQILHQQNSVLDDLVERADPVAAAVSRHDGRDLDEMVDEVRQTLQALGDNQKAIEQTVEQLPTTLREAQRTLDNLSSVSSSVAPTLRQARPLTSKLPRISDEIVHFSKYADPAFKGFGPLFREADTLLKEAAPEVHTLRTAGPHLQGTAKQARKVGTVLLHDHLDDLMSFVTKWALSTNSRDGASHYFRGVFYVTPKDLLTMAGGAPSLGNLTSGGTSTSGLTGTLSNLTGSLGSLGSLTNLGGTLGNLTNSLGGLTSLSGQRTTSGTSATGLTDSQEHNLLAQLLGGK